MTKDTLPSVDLVIPALNEEVNIAGLLEVLPWSRLRHVVVADNGSTDHTADLAHAGGAQVVQEPHRGYGGACLAALDWIACHPPVPDMVAFLDADLADDPAHLVNLIKPIDSGKADLVMGSRHRLAQQHAMNPAQRFGNFVACTLLRLTTGVTFTDLGPQRVIRYSSLQRLDMTDRTWGWTVEMQFKAAARGLRCIEIDVPYRRRHAGHSKISGSMTGAVAAGYRIIVTIAQLWWQHRRHHHLSM